MRKRQIAISVIVVIALLLAGCGSDESSIIDQQSGEPQQTFVGSVNSNKYHYPSCQWALKIKPENEIVFGSPEEARGAGYIPCKVCSPP